MATKSLENELISRSSMQVSSACVGKLELQRQGGVTPIEPVQTFSTTVKILDRPK